jgi:hypothetical protein
VGIPKVGLHLLRSSIVEVEEYGILAGNSKAVIGMKLADVSGERSQNDILMKQTVNFFEERLSVLQLCLKVSFQLLRKPVTS